MQYSAHLHAQAGPLLLSQGSHIKLQLSPMKKPAGSICLGVLLTFIAVAK